MTTQYSAVKTRDSDSGWWTPFWKQLHITSGVWTLYFMNGLTAGAPTVIIPQIRRHWNSTVDDEMASWLYSSSNLSALPWLFFLPALSHFIGRRIPYITCSIAMTVVFFLLYFSTAAHHILIALGIQGFVNAIGVTIIINLIPEYCSQKYRNLYINIQCTTFYWGMWVSNAIGTFFDWKYIAVLGLICAVYSFSVALSPESPLWLASKGKISECEKAHRWLHGSGSEAEGNLRDLIKSQRDRDRSKLTCSGIMEIIICQQFYMPVFLVILTGVLYNLSGKFICSVYAIEILIKITKNEDTAYTGMLILDGVTVFGMYAGSFISKFFKLRPLFFSLTFISICVMYTFSLYLYLAKLGIIIENNVFTLSFLVVYSLAISSGPVVLSLNFYSELISIRYQAVSYTIISFVFLASSTGLLKFAPVIFSEFGLHGSFLLYGITCTITAGLLFHFLPETKGKSLIEIEKCFNNTKSETEQLNSVRETS